MGAGNRFQWNTIGGLVFGMAIDRFPYNWTISLYLGPVWVSYGFGKGYDE